MKATLIGILLDLGAKNLGVDIGPNAFRYQSIIQKLENSGIHISDSGNIVCHDRNTLDQGEANLKYLSEIVRVSEDSAKKAAEAVKKRHKLIGLGGDHSITLGLFAGVSMAVKGDIGMIYFDAHGDMNTPETTLTGNIHGMHLAALMGFGDKRLVNVFGTGAKLRTENLIHIAGCDFDQAETDLAAKQKLKTFSIADMLASGMGPLLVMIDDLAKRVPNIYISLDLDAIDSLYAPGAGMPNRGGLTFREVIALADYIGKRCNVIAVDVVEYNPLQDEQCKTAELGIELIAKFLGQNYSWYSNYMSKNKV
ncbi:MAG: arginase [Candidatus Levyibacteriota bacterium]